MKKIFLTTALILAFGFYSANAQVDSDEDIVEDESLTQDTLTDDPFEADSAIMEDGEIIEDRITVDTTEMEDSEDMQLPSDRNRNVPKSEDEIKMEEDTLNNLDE